MVCRAVFKVGLPYLPTYICIQAAMKTEYWIRFLKASKSNYTCRICCNWSLFCISSQVCVWWTHYSSCRAPLPSPRLMVMHESDTGCCDGLGLLLKVQSFQIPSQPNTKSNWSQCKKSCVKP